MAEYLDTLRDVPVAGEHRVLFLLHAVRQKENFAEKIRK